MPMVLENEISTLLGNDDDYRQLKSGNGLYLNPYNTIREAQIEDNNPYKKRQYNGDGIFDILGSLAKTGVDLFKEHGSTLNNLAGVVSGAANTYKAIKDIQKGNDELNE